MRTKFPAGTTKEQWDRYKEDLVSHEQFIASYKFFLERICRHLKSKKRDTWTVDEIMETMTSEIRMSQSMDAPNEPGYYRANND